MPTETVLLELDDQTPTDEEAQLGNEIGQLWHARVSAHGSLRKNQEGVEAHPGELSWETPRA
jgi:hypothetical protein